MTDAELAALYYDHEYTLAQLAERVGLSVTGVWARIQRAVPRPYKLELKDAVERWGVTGAAEEYGVTPATIKRWCKLDGIKPPLKEDDNGYYKLAF